MWKNDILNYLFFHKTVQLNLCSFKEVDWLLTFSRACVRACARARARTSNQRHTNAASDVRNWKMEAAKRKQSALEWCCVVACSVANGICCHVPSLVENLTNISTAFKHSSVRVLLMQFLIICLHSTGIVPYRLCVGSYMKLLDAEIILFLNEIDNSLLPAMKIKDNSETQSLYCIWVKSLKTSSQTTWGCTIQDGFQVEMSGCLLLVWQTHTVIRLECWKW